VDLKLFVSSTWQSRVEALACVRQGHIPVCNLPEWHADELREMLVMRVKAFTKLPGYGERGIPPELYSRLRGTLLRCDEFSGDDQLRAVFVNGRIVQWRDRLPEASSREVRVMLVIDYLFERSRRDTEENALVLLLRVLADPIDHADARRQRLLDLASALERERPDDHADVDWPDLIPDDYLDPKKAKHRLIPIILDGALRTSFRGVEVDAPIHALRLARGLVAACAGCWPIRYPPPLNTTQLQEIVDHYWEEEEDDVVSGPQ
jgi:hypothetical protein